MNAWFGNEFNRKNTWFSQIDSYLTYLKRVNFMLQQGKNVADVAYFIGEDAPKMTGVTDPALPIGYQFDYMNAEVIEKYMSVRDRLITLAGGAQYKLLVLPKMQTMRPEVLQKIEQLVKDGAVILGPAPLRSPSLQGQPATDKKLKSLAATLWGAVDGKKIKYRRYGKGMVLDGMSMIEALALINCIPDCKLPEDSTVVFGHRQMQDGDIYFLSNQTAKEQVVSPAFRVKNRQPELWDPATGYMRKLPAYSLNQNSTTVPVKLAAYQSIFIVFRYPANHSSNSGVEMNYPEPVLLTKLNGPWTVTFDSTMRGPAEPVVFDTLKDWTHSNDDRIKYYSGTATYHYAFQLDKIINDKRTWIDLGNVVAMAKVSINGKLVGGLWTAPYQIDITDYVKQGKNDLRIEVVNTWVNRLIGDSRLPETERKTWCPVNPYTKDSTLQSSGLLGPVCVTMKEY
jgi:hypothetical protein